MPIPRSRRIVFLRTSIIATGVTLGLILQWIWPPRDDVLFDSKGTGGARPRAGRPDQNSQVPLPSSGWRPQAEEEANTAENTTPSSAPNP